MRLKARLFGETKRPGLLHSSYVREKRSTYTDCMLMVCYKFNDVTIIYFLSNANRRSFASLVNSAILQAQMQKGNEDISHLLGEEDSDEWLSIDESMMDNMLGRTQTTLSAHREASMDVDEGLLGELEESPAREQANQLRTLASKVESFVAGQGDIEGATFEE